MCRGLVMSSQVMRLRDHLCVQETFWLAGIHDLLLKKNIFMWLKIFNWWSLSKNLFASLLNHQSDLKDQPESIALFTKASKRRKQDKTRSFEGRWDALSGFYTSVAAARSDNDVWNRDHLQQNVDLGWHKLKRFWDDGKFFTSRLWKSFYLQIMKRSRGVIIFWRSRHLGIEGFDKYCHDCSINNVIIMTRMIIMMTSQWIIGGCHHHHHHQSY